MTIEGLFIIYKEIINMKKAKPTIIKVFAGIKETETLIDNRYGRHFSVFGNVLDVAKQYGIKSEIVPNGIVFEAPKERMQVFVEKLHFSSISYFEI